MFVSYQSIGVLVKLVLYLVNVGVDKQKELMHDLFLFYLKTKTKKG